MRAVATIRENNLRLLRMITWENENYSRCANNVVIKLTREQIKNTDLYYRSTHNFKYDELDADLIKAFLSANKVKSVDSEGTEAFYSFDNIRKFKDAILFGAKRAKVMLSGQFRVDINSYIESWKKENQKAKKDGKVSEQEADPILFPLYSTICS